MERGRKGKRERENMKSEGWREREREREEGSACFVSHKVEVADFLGVVKEKGWYQTYHVRLRQHGQCFWTEREGGN